MSDFWGLLIVVNLVVCVFRLRDIWIVLCRIESINHQTRDQ